VADETQEEQAGGFLNGLMNSAIPGIAGDKSKLRNARQDAISERRGNSQALDALAGSNVLQYPQDLFLANQVNGVCFYVMVRKNSVAGQNSGAVSGAAAERINAHQDSRSEFATSVNRSSVENYATVVGAGGIVAGATIMSGLKVLPGSGKATKTGAAQKLWSAALGAAQVVGGAIGGKMIADHMLNVEDGKRKVGSLSPGTKYLNKVIQMHVPQAIISQYQADWNETDLGMAGMLANKRLDQADISEVGESAIRGIISGAANIPKAMGIDMDLGGALEATSRKTSNPYKEQLFKSMGFRSFAFQYQFSPKNEAEYNNVRAIINTFKYHMHPDISPGQTFLIYPSEFTIEFLHSDKGAVARNEHLPKISDCALKDVKVTYGPDGFFNTIAGTKGIPSEITMELNFTELEVLTANRIDQGY